MNKRVMSPEPPTMADLPSEILAKIASNLAEPVVANNQKPASSEDMPDSWQSFHGPTTVPMSDLVAMRGTCTRFRAAVDEATLTALRDPQVNTSGGMYIMTPHYLPTEEAWDFVKSYWFVRPGPATAARWNHEDAMVGLSESTGWIWLRALLRRSGCDKHILLPNPSRHRLNWLYKDMSRLHALQSYVPSTVEVVHDMYSCVQGETFGICTCSASRTLRGYEKYCGWGHPISKTIFKFLFQEFLHPLVHTDNHICTIFLSLCLQDRPTHLPVLEDIVRCNPVNLVLPEKAWYVDNFLNKTIAHTRMHNVPKEKWLYLRAWQLLDPDYKCIVPGQELAALTFSLSHAMANPYPSTKEDMYTMFADVYDRWASLGVVPTGTGNTRGIPINIKNVASDYTHLLWQIRKRYFPTELQQSELFATRWDVLKHVLTDKAPGMFSVSMVSSP